VDNSLALVAVAHDHQGIPAARELSVVAEAALHLLAQGSALYGYCCADCLANSPSLKLSNTLSIQSLTIMKPHSQSYLKHSYNIEIPKTAISIQYQTLLQ
jgi:hypothetical protein